MCHDRIKHATNCTKRLRESVQRTHTQNNKYLTAEETVLISPTELLFPLKLHFNMVIEYKLNKVRHKKTTTKLHELRLQQNSALIRSTEQAGMEDPQANLYPRLKCISSTKNKLC